MVPNWLLAAVNGFNANHSQKVAASSLKVLDKLLSVWCAPSENLVWWPLAPFLNPKEAGTPRNRVQSKFLIETTAIDSATTNLPALFYNKSLCCYISGVIIQLEIQNGKKPMKAFSYHDKAVATVACTKRLFQATEYCRQENAEWQHAKEEEWQECFITDSWFGSVIVTNQVKAIHEQDDQGMPKGQKFISAL
jgi:hypothetical protein